MKNPVTRVVAATRSLGSPPAIARHSVQDGRAQMVKGIRMATLKTLCCGVLLASAPAAVSQSPRGSITIDRIAEIKYPTEPAWSPDGALSRRDSFLPASDRLARRLEARGAVLRRTPQTRSGVAQPVTRMLGETSELALKRETTMRVLARHLVTGILTILLMATAASAQQTGTLSGLVRDAQGGVLPGVTVTVTGAALIGGPRVAVTGAAGSYQLAALPPGTYDVVYELTGFTPLRREGIVVGVAQVSRLDVELGIGALEQSVIVSGQSPVVDVSTTVTQTNLTKDLYEALPVSRNPWTMAALVPGVVAAKLDVGGTSSMQQYNLEAFGSADSQKSFSIDGLKTNWGGGNGGATMIYYGNEMFEEYNMQTASGTAESDVSGVYMNMVTKSGGNRFTSDHNFYFMNDALQSDNVDDALRTRLGLGAGQGSAAAGNPIDISHDWSSTLGGPIKRDKLWFFGAARWWVLNQFLVGALNPDGSRIIDDNRNLNFSGKVTWQTTPTVKTSFLYNRNYIERFHRRNPPYLFVPDIATQLQDQKAENYVFSYNQIFGSRLVLEGRAGRMWGVNPAKYQPEVKPTDISVRDISLFTIENALPGQSLNPNSRDQVNGAASYFIAGGGAGSHDLKAGVQLSWEDMAYDQVTNGDRYGDLNNGVAFRANFEQHADPLRPPAAELGYVLPGSLDHRPRDSQRRSPSGRCQRLSAGADESGGHVRRRAVVPEDRRLLVRPGRRAASRRRL